MICHLSLRCCGSQFPWLVLPVCFLKCLALVQEAVVEHRGRRTVKIKRVIKDTAVSLIKLVCDKVIKRFTAMRIGSCPGLGKWTEVRYFLSVGF